MTLKVMLALGALFGAFAAPSVVAAVGFRSPDADPDWWSGIRDLGPAGGLALGLLVIAWRAVAWLRPKAEAWFDAGTEEREAMRDLARSLKQRFSEEDREERGLLRAALDELRSGRREQ